jgi:hypothetical protein
MGDTEHIAQLDAGDEPGGNPVVDQTVGHGLRTVPSTWSNDDCTSPDAQSSVWQIVDPQERPGGAKSCLHVGLCGSQVSLPCRVRGRP